METSSSSFIPTPLAHADNLGEGQPRGASLQFGAQKRTLYSFKRVSRGSCAITAKKAQRQLESQPASSKAFAQEIPDRERVNNALCAFATRGLLATDHVILNHGQVTWTTPELAPPLLTTTPHQREDVSALDRFNVHRCPTRRVFSGTGLDPVTKQATVRYLYHSATAATLLPLKTFRVEEPMT
ncbi:uncharacterized protein TNCV_3548891 [Trichonephila clavipes]|nr:uncharacterized protein TNCV_3548891 [Trichonephila clavipes]